MVYIIIGCGAGLRGEEVPLLSLKGLRDFWVETRDDPEPFIMATLYGRFKGETGYRWHCLPICDSSRSAMASAVSIAIRMNSTSSLLNKD